MDAVDFIKRVRLWLAMGISVDEIRDKLRRHGLDEGSSYLIYKAACL